MLHITLSSDHHKKQRVVPREGEREREIKTPNTQACGHNTTRTRCFHSVSPLQSHKEDNRNKIEISKESLQFPEHSQVSSPKPALHLLLLESLLVVSHGEVIAPDFSDFLLLDKAAACFRSSRFLACNCSVTSLWVFSIWFILALI